MSKKCCIWWKCFNLQWQHDENGSLNQSRNLARPLFTGQTVVSINSPIKLPSKRNPWEHSVAIHTNKPLYTIFFGEMMTFFNAVTIQIVVWKLKVKFQHFRTLNVIVLRALWCLKIATHSTIGCPFILYSN
jgi:hypothetical protein